MKGGLFNAAINNLDLQYDLFMESILMFTDVLPSTPRAIILSLNQIQEHLQSHKACKTHGMNFTAFLLVPLLLSHYNPNLPGSVNFFISTRTFLSKKYDIIKLAALKTHSVDNSNEVKTKYLGPIFPHRTEGEVYYSRRL